MRLASFDSGLPLVPNTSSHAPRLLPRPQHSLAAGTYINEQGAKFEGEWEGDKPKRRCPLPDHVKRFIAETQVRGWAWAEHTTRRRALELPFLLQAIAAAISPLLHLHASFTLPQVYDEMPDEEHETIGKRHVVTENPRLSIYGETPYGGLVYDTPSFDYDTKKGAQGAGAAVNKAGTYDKVKSSPVNSTSGSQRGGGYDQVRSGPSSGGYDQVRSAPAAASQGTERSSAIAQSIAAAGRADPGRTMGTYDAAGKLGTYDAARKLGTYDAARGVGTYGAAAEPTYDVGTGTGVDSVYSTIDHKGSAGIQQRIREAGQQDSYMQASSRGGKESLRAIGDIEKERYNVSSMSLP